MQYYEWDDLLGEDALVALTDEALARPARRKSWRRLAALAACAALVLCLANFGAIAAGVQELARYISGVGTAAPEERIYIQEEPVEWVYGDTTFRVEGAFQIGGYVYLTVEALSDKAGQPCALWMQLRQDGEILPVYFGSDWAEEYSDSMTPFRGPEEWNAQYDELGLNFPARYEEVRAVAMFGGSFQAGAGGGYELVLRAGSDGPECVLALNLTDRTEELTATQRTFDLNGEPVYASVSGDGRRLFVQMDQRASNGWSINTAYPNFVTFVDEAGNRYTGSARCMYYVGRPALEVLLEEEPEAPVAAVEIGGMSVGFEDLSRPKSDDGRFHDWKIDRLDWRIELK